MKNKSVHILIFGFILIATTFLLPSLRVVGLRYIYDMRPLYANAVESVTEYDEGNLYLPKVIEGISERRGSLRERIARNRQLNEDVNNGSTKEAILLKQNNSLKRVDIVEARINYADINQSLIEANKKKFLLYEVYYQIMKNKSIKGQAIGLRSPPSLA